LVFPFVKLRPVHALARQKSHRFQSGAPETLADIHQDAIDIEN
jgi:hypothetical protein